MSNAATATPPNANAALVLADGTVFFGKGIGAPGDTFGEICFNTAMTGYQEILTDLSYAGQIITFTFPHIGNVGANDEDIESRKPAVSGLVVRELPAAPSNFRSKSSLDEWLKTNEITGISGVDTRSLTRRIRIHGAQNVAITYAGEGQELDIPGIKQRLAQVPDLEGLELAKGVSVTKPYTWNQTRWALKNGYGLTQKEEYHVVAVDFGEKLNILRCLASRNCRITVVPATTTAEEIMALKPDGIFLSNGPGDPAATGEYAVPVIRQMIDSNTPVFGICLGHQLLGLALGAETEKMHQGHRGANHPIKNLQTGKVEITSQNHGFVVSHSSLPVGVIPTHTSLFDGTIAGLRVEGKPVFCVQYHPESSPGPHDSQYLFDQFIDLMKKNKNA